MNTKGTPEKVDSPDTGIDWYDFGGGSTVAPTTFLASDGKTEKIPGVGEGSTMAALSCVKNGLLYYKILTGDFTEKDLPNMLKDHTPTFQQEVNAATA
jgi:hypothetical protein